MNRRRQTIRTPRGGARRRTRRCAAATLEAILALPILIILFFGTFLFGMILTVLSGVTNAAVEGAREAAKETQTITLGDDRRNAAVSTVNQVLGVYGLSLDCLSPSPSSLAQVIVEDPTGIRCCGTNIIACPPQTPGFPANTVRVRVLVRFNVIPIPNFLVNYGIDTSGKYFDVCSDARPDCT